MTPPPPTTRTTTVTVGGHTYRVNASATDEQLERLAAIVDERLMALSLAQRGDPKSLVLVALGLAHDLDHERQLRTTERQESTTRIRQMVTRIDEALGHVDLDGEPLDQLQPMTDPTPASAVVTTDAPVTVPRAVVQTSPRTRPTKRGSELP